MVLTFTGSISAAEAHRSSEIRTLLFGAIGCNLAWGMVEAVMYLMAQLTERGRVIFLLKSLRKTSNAVEAHRKIANALPPKVAAALQPTDLERIRQHLNAEPDPPEHPRFGKEDYLGAVAVFLLVFLSTFPVVVPFMLMDHVKPAMRTSNAIAVALLFLVGFRLGQYAGVHPWRWGLSTIMLGGVLVAITIALGG